MVNQNFSQSISPFTKRNNRTIIRKTPNKTFLTSKTKLHSEIDLAEKKSLFEKSEFKIIDKSMKISNPYLSIYCTPSPFKHKYFTPLKSSIHPQNNLNHTTFSNSKQISSDIQKTILEWDLQNQKLIYTKQNFVQKPQILYDSSKINSNLKTINKNAFSSDIRISLQHEGDELQRIFTV